MILTQCLPALQAHSTGGVPCRERWGSQGWEAGGKWVCVGVRTWVMRNFGEALRQPALLAGEDHLQHVPSGFSITTNTFSGVSGATHSRLTIPGCRRLWGG